MVLRKSVEQIQQETRTSELKRSLGPWNLVFLGIGCIIGAGIFVRTGNAAALHAGPAVLISYAIAGIICAFAGLCYAELASTLPVSGSAYTYSYATIGEFAAWVMGALLLLEYGLAASVVAVGWSGYVVSLLGDFGLHHPRGRSPGPTGHHLQKDGVDVLVNGAPIVYLFNLPAFLVCSALAILLVIGVAESAKFNNVIVAIKVTVLTAFILVGGFIILKNLPTYMPNWHPFIPPPTGVKGEFGWSGILRAASIVFFAYIGFEAVSTAGQEAKDPAKDMPFGIVGSLIACTVIYILVSVVMTLIVPYTSLNVPDPVAVAVDAFGPQWAWFAKTIKVGAIIGLTSVILVLMYGQTRIFYTMARDGLLPKLFARVHPKFRTPWINTLIVGPRGRLCRRFLRHQLPRRCDLGRHARRVRHRLLHGDLAAPHPSGYSARLSRAALSGLAGAWDRQLLRADLHGRKSGADLLRLVHRRRDRALLRLRHAQFGAGQGTSSARGRRTGLLPRGRALGTSSGKPRRCRP